MEAGFLVMLDRVLYFVKRNQDGSPAGTPFPNTAAMLPYGAADRLSRALREQNYPDAVVVDRFGQLVILSDIKEQFRYSVVYKDGTRFFAEMPGNAVHGVTLPWDAARLSKGAALEIQRRMIELGIHDAEVVPNDRGLAMELDKVWIDIPETIYEAETQGNDPSAH